MSANNVVRRAIPVLLAIGVALRLWQSLGDGSFWFDEFSIARNIEERSASDLILHPLGYLQVAPVGFMLLVKASTLVFGSSDLAMRFTLLPIGIAALLLFWRVARRVLDATGVALAVGLFALGIPLIRFSAELKPYGIDVAAGLALTLIALDLRSGAPGARRCILAGLTGFVCIWFSYASVFVMAGLGAALVIAWWQTGDRTVPYPVLLTVPFWALASLTGVFAARHYATPETLDFMHRFWTSHHGFAPLPVDLVTIGPWLWVRLDQFLGSAGMRYQWSQMYVVLAFAGFAVLWRRRTEYALIVIAPIIVTLLAAIAQQYPLRTRVVLFLLPNFLLGIAAFIEWAWVRISALSSPLAAAALVTLATPPAYAVAVARPVYYVEDFKTPLRYLQSHRVDGDAVYVYANAFEGVKHYGARFGLPATSWEAGICDAHDVRPYLRDVDRFRGTRRLWVVGSSVPDFRIPRMAIRRYLQTLGIRRDSVLVPSAAPLDPVSAELFDLSDTTRLRSTTASTFAVPTIPDTLPPLCGDWTQPR